MGAWMRMCVLTCVHACVHVCMCAYVHVCVVVCPCKGVYVRTYICLLWHTLSVSVEGGEDDSASSNRLVGGEAGPEDGLVPSVK